MCWKRESNQVTIYPVYAVSLLIAGFSGMISGTLPSGWILLMQAKRTDYGPGFLCTPATFPGLAGAGMGAIHYRERLANAVLA